MSYLTDTTREEITAEREEIRREVTIKLREMDWPADLHRLKLLRDGWQDHIDEADRRIAEAVKRFRTTGGSWADVGFVLGISKQAAQQRFGQ